MPDLLLDPNAERFTGLARVYGQDGLGLLRKLRVCVIGLGGVGSWAAEALARSAVGELTLIDGDEIAPSNTNRQIHALGENFGRRKVEVMAERVREINPDCECRPIDEYLTTQNLTEMLAGDFDYVVDAIDSIKFKAALIHHCRRNKIPLIATGGAGGLTDPAKIQVADLSRTRNDPLAAKLRARLRAEYSFPRDPSKRFGVECVFSSQQPVYPRADGSVGHEKPGIHGVSLDCRFGYGSASVVTAAFGLIAASRVIDKGLARARRNPT
jgi:tRNA A37 threonylcarbamoyladenosine dehydratase